MKNLEPKVIESAPAELRASVYAIPMGVVRGSHDKLLSPLVRFSRREPVGAGAALVLTLMVCVSLASPWLAPHDPNLFHYANVLQGPTRTYIAGTDQFGRDILSRILHGGRVSLFIAITSISLSAVVGTALGLVSGYFGRTVDLVIQRVTDAVMAFPLLILAIILVTVLGHSVLNVIIAIAVTQVPNVTKVIRSVTLAVKEEPFVEAARTVGAGGPRILGLHILPNVIAPLIVLLTNALAVAVLVEASISFLGLGPPPPNATWGSMLGSDARQYFTQAPWIAVFPGLTISIVVLSVNMLGDALRDHLDPRLKGR